MLHLFPNRNQFVPLADTDAEQSCQGIYHFYRILTPLLLAHPADRIQRILKKMRVDLGLERLQLRFTQCNFLSPDLFHQILYPADHMTKGI